MAYPQIPHYYYGTASPSPRPSFVNSYGQPAPPVPGPATNASPVQGVHHHNPQGRYQPQTAPRGSQRGGYNNSRGAHHYNPYVHPGHHPHAHLYHPAAAHHPHLPYSPPPQQKFVTPYSPTTYSYPSPTAPVFTPSWQTQQALSPLPKQLSMPQPPATPPVAPVSPLVVEQQQYYVPPPPPHIPVEPVVEPAPEHIAQSEPVVVESESTSSTEAISIVAPASSEDEQPAAEEPEPSPAPVHAPFTHIGSINTTSSVDIVGDASLPAQPSINLAIWSRKPRDPKHAPGIIISPRARPPRHVVDLASTQRTPPPSPRPVVAKAIPPPEPKLAGATLPTSSGIPSSSSSATESTPTATLPASPASSNTSLSASVVVPEPPVTTSAKEDATTTLTPLVSESAAPTPTNVPAPEPAPSTDSTTLPKADLAPSSTISAPTDSTPVGAPVVSSSAPAPTPVKKSWAALLKPADSPASAIAGAPSGAKNALPTSNVVGFSIPASALAGLGSGGINGSSGKGIPVSGSKKSDLVSLLTSGPSAFTQATPVSTASSYAAATLSKNAANAVDEKDPTQAIRLRGLINSGNMCFANSVLQVLVYCAPFHGFFRELGKLVSGAGEALDQTPLVDATIDFLKEFVDPPSTREKAKDVRERVVVGGRGSVPVNGFASGSGKSKGKERAFEDSSNGRWDTEMEGESFLPTYVYDAMRLKKRFDGMRGGQQEDAEEFFGFYLDTLEEELLALLNVVNPPKPDPPAPEAKTSIGKARKASAAPSHESVVEEKEEPAPPQDLGWLEVGRRNRMVVLRTVKATESPITRIFGGKFRSTLRVPGQKDSVVVEDWRSLRLDIQRDQIHTIQDALSYISHPQPVQLSQPAKTPSDPRITVEAQQQVLIEYLPPILVLHIKRFCYDTTVGGVVKVGKQVTFGPELVVGSDVMVPNARKPVKYKLFGALYHHGQSASGGHYTLDVLHPNRFPGVGQQKAAEKREGWVRVDDELVSDVRHEDVFGSTERDDGRTAYLLFYRRL